MPPVTEFADIQGLVARGYRELHAAVYIVLRIDDPSAARGWLGQVAVTPATARPTETATQLALTASGLARLDRARRHSRSAFVAAVLSDADRASWEVLLHD